MSRCSDSRSRSCGSRRRSASVFRVVCGRRRMATRASNARSISHSSGARRRTSIVRPRSERPTRDGTSPLGDAGRAAASRASRRGTSCLLLSRARTQRRVNRGLLSVPRPPRARRWAVWCGSSAWGSRPNRIGGDRFRPPRARPRTEGFFVHARAARGARGSFSPHFLAIGRHDAPRCTAARRSPSSFSSRARGAMPPPPRRPRHLRSRPCRPCHRRHPRHPPRRRRPRPRHRPRPRRPRGSSARTSRRSPKARC